MHSNTQREHDVEKRWVMKEQIYDNFVKLLVYCKNQECFPAPGTISSPVLIAANIVTGEVDVLLIQGKYMVLDFGWSDMPASRDFIIL